MYLRPPGLDTALLCNNPTIIPSNITPAEAEWLRAFYSEPDSEQKQQARAMAAAAAVAADAAIAASQAAAAAAAVVVGFTGNNQFLLLIAISRINLMSMQLHYTAEGYRHQLMLSPTHWKIVEMDMGCRPKSTSRTGDAWTSDSCDNSTSSPLSCHIPARDARVRQAELVRPRMEPLFYPTKHSKICQHLRMQCSSHAGKE